ncbi:MAG TPA: hypothetical protein VMT12_10110 [Syntrophales bacterium]|nr:hypothetical protein [Syntrophales bacterium]
MKKEEKEYREKVKNQEDRLLSADSGEYGFEYEFFITENNVMEKSSTKFQPIVQEKKEYASDQTEIFFLPDFFSHDD